MGETYVVSDVHGHREDLVRGLARAGLVAGDPLRPDWAGGDARLFVLGDLTDRGPDGIGVIELLIRLQEQAPGQVHVLLGNHEALAIGTKRFPTTRFVDSWLWNGGLARDQEALTARHVDWLSSLPAVARAGEHLLVHSDTTGYLGWGPGVAEVNERVAGLLASASFDDVWEVWARLTRRYDFTGPAGAGEAQRLLSGLGGSLVVHGHSIIGSLAGVASAEVSGPLLYADGLALDVDGGRYDGGPLLLVRL